MQNTKNVKKPGLLSSVLSGINSTVGRKYIMGATGIALVLFTIIHLLGNLTIFVGADALNSYTHKLESLGFLLTIAEIGLLATIVFHIVFAFSVTGQNKSARNQNYAVNGNTGAPSKKTAASKYMIVSGLFILGFIVWHVVAFRFHYFGLFGPEGTTTIHGTPMRDVYPVVHEFFKNPLTLIFSVVAMLFLGLHLRHGFWSAFQSLGAHHPRYTPLIYTLGGLIGFVLAVGFLALPVWLFIQPLA